MRAIHLLALALVFAVAWPLCADARDRKDREPGPGEARFSGRLTSLSDEELQRRIDFLTERLEKRRPGAQLWQRGFTAGWSLGVGIGALQVGLNSDHDDQLNGALTAGKAAIGVARLVLDPTPARLGASPIQAIEGEDREAQEARLRAGEEQLQRVARRARRRFNWIAHAFNLALNTAAGLTVIFYGNPSDAITQIGVSTVAGEIMLWTDPWHGAADLEEYRSSVIGPDWPVEPAVRWRIAPMSTGLAFTLEF